MLIISSSLCKDGIAKKVVGIVGRIHEGMAFSKAGASEHI